MNELPVLGAILALTLVSAYFASSETAMMAVNRYRMRHLANAGHRGAQKASRLLERSDRLLGGILVGNNLVNFIIASLAAVIGNRLLGETLSTIVTPVVLTLFVLIFAEVTPKTIAAQRPEAIAFPSSYILGPVLAVLTPLVVFINAIANALARPMVARAKQSSDALSMDELKTVVNEHAAIPAKHQDMLVRILELGDSTVDDILVSRSDVVGIDVDDDKADLVAAIEGSQYTRLPVFQEQVNEVLGILHLRRAARLLRQGEFTRQDLLEQCDEPYFIPEGTPLNVQLINFQKHKQRFALVVDEYGDVVGIVTLEDILEEIVGEFTTDFADALAEVLPQTDGAYLIEGRALLREVNRMLGWELPTAGPRTLNGLIVEHLEFIPEANVCLRIDRYRIETLQISDNVVRTVKVWEMPAENAA